MQPTEKKIENGTYAEAQSDWLDTLGMEPAEALGEIEEPEYPEAPPDFQCHL